MGKIIELKQGSPEWHAFRKDKIGSSDAAPIMGASKWTTPWQLYMRKLGLIPQQEDNYAMANGRDKESEALSAFNQLYDCKCVPAVMVHEKYPWMIASLDGWDPEKQIAVEIKCPGKEDHELGIVPPHYYYQLQHQMFVIGIPHMYYWSWHKDCGKSILENEDEESTDIMLIKELDFMSRLKELDPPELCERDYLENNSREWKYSVLHYNACKKEKDDAESAYEQAREELIRQANNHNCKGSGIRVSKNVRKGNIEYSRIKELEKVDLEQYRKPCITTWRIAEE